MDANGWGIVLILGMAAAIVAVVVTLLMQVFSLARARAAGEAAAAREARDEELRRVAAELGEVRTRLAEVEKRPHGAA